MEPKRAKDKLWIGMVTGLLVPIAAYGLLQGLISILHVTGLLDEAVLSGDFPHRTLSLLAICCNLIPFRMFNRQYLYNRMRGVVFPTLLYVVVWLILFYDVIFG